MTAIAVLAVLARLPFVGQDPSRDEAGFLLVGQQWHAGGSSLYGDYWVDRPPLLITIFRVAAELGGLVPLRLIGCVATFLVVVGAAHVARRIAGAQASYWAAVTAAALCVSPLLGGLSVNGELLSAPFVVGGMAAVLAALEHRDQTRATVLAGFAGAATVAALLVKQNIADVAVFAVVAALVAWHQRRINTARLLRSVAAYSTGAVICLAGAAVWTLLHGTSLAGVFDAMYPFRLEAGRVMAASNRSSADARLWLLVVCWAVSGVAVIMAVFTWSVVSLRLRGAAVWALTATVAFDLVSIMLGGSYWNHYLIQLVVPIAVMSGVLVGQTAIRRLLSVTALVAAIAVGVAYAGPNNKVGSSVGRAVANVAHPQDTIVTAWGHADVTRTSGLTSPYPYLWSLPARTLDPKLAALDTLLAGPEAPTWFVAWSDVGSGARAGGARTQRLLSERYRVVARVGSHIVYLHRGVERASPRLVPDSPPLSGSGRLPTSSNAPAQEKP